jgi:hypothetical protein
VPGGRLQVYRLHLEPAASLEYPNPSQEGEGTILCERGEIRFAIAEEDYNLNIGDSVHFTETFSPAIHNASRTEAADLILISTRRHSIDDL